MKYVPESVVGKKIIIGLDNWSAPNKRQVII